MATQNVITQSGRHVYSDGKLVGSYADEAAAKAAQAEYTSIPKNIAGDTGGATYRVTQNKDAYAALEAEQAKQNGLGSPISGNGEAALAQGLETPEQTMTRVKAAVKPAPSVFTSSDASKRDATNMADYERYTQQLAENNARRYTSSTGSSGTTESTTTPSSDTGGMTYTDKVNKDLQSILDQSQAAYDDYKKQVDSIINGSFNLSPSDQAQLQDIKNSIDRAAREQQTANKAQLGIVKRLGIRSGRQRYASEIDTGIIGAEIAAGVQRISDIEMKGASILNTAKQAMLDKNMKLLDAAMNQFNLLQKTKSDTIQQMASNTFNAEQLAIAKAKEYREQAKADQEAYEKEIQSSREATILDLLGQGVTNPIDIVSLVNHDAEGNLVGDITTKEVTDLMVALKSVKEDPTKSDVRGSPNEGFYEFKTDPVTGETTVRQLLRPQKPPESDEVLSVSDAASLGVPYGTTAGQAQKMGIDPAAIAAAKKTSKPATQAEYIVGTYAVRAEQATDELDSDVVSNYIAGLKPSKFLVLEKAPNILRPSEFQQYDQARRNFLTAVLRRESGAVISDQEMNNAEKQYFPAPGDSAEVLAQKKRNRDLVTNSLIKSSGPAYYELSPKALQEGDTSSSGEFDYKSLLDSGQITEDEYQELIKTNDLGTSQNGLGTLSERYESGGDPGVIGYDSTGGYSYGTYQLAHNNAKSFISQSPYASEFKGLTFNSPEWRNKWKQVAKADPEGFGEAQKSYIKKTHFDPQVNKLASAGIDVGNYSPVVQDVIWSTAVQHGANTPIIVNAIKSLGPNPSEEDIIKAIYKARWGGGSQFASSTKSVKDSVYNRFFGPNGEMKLALSRLNTA